MKFVAFFNFAGLSICANKCGNIRDILIFIANFEQFNILQHFYVRGKICAVKTQQTRNTRKFVEKLGRENKQEKVGKLGLLDSLQLLSNRKPLIIPHTIDDSGFLHSELEFQNSHTQKQVYINKVQVSSLSEYVSLRKNCLAKATLIIQW